MEYGNYAVVNIKGADPEAFMIFFTNSHHPKPGFLWTSSRDLTEGELRDALATMGHTEARINRLIKRPRENPM